MMNEKEKEMVDLMPGLFDTSSEWKEKCDRFASVTERAVNSFGVHAKEIVDCVRENKETEETFCKIAYAWIRMLDYDARERCWDDARNRYSVETGRTLYENEGIRAKVDSFIDLNNAELRMCINYATKIRRDDAWVEIDPWVYIVARLYRIHRTLFQSFSKIVFCYLNETEEVLRELKSNGTLSETWWRCPLI